MGWTTFMDIVIQLASHIACQDINIHLPLTADTPNSYHFIINQFGMDKTTAGEASWKVCLVIQEVLASCFIHLVNVQEVIPGFCCMCSPNCVEAGDGIHIPILYLAQAMQAFINCKGTLLSSAS
ncbi:hypothetical protein Y1Q_0017944 [Alligator mississippiensis]|uniref:Uncharacterized protein n=1 Tax=Alligator mississippiensis TaxID=8496 RepID=A0A151MXX4_ALLMI|nr:hypothetical protein Y1Q_0017944 [Alligator mississippiensis]